LHLIKHIIFIDIKTFALSNFFRNLRYLYKTYGTYLAICKSRRSKSRVFIFI